MKKGKKQKEHSAFVLQVAVMEAACTPKQQEWHQFFPGDHTISASSRHGSDLCVWEPVLCFDLFCAPVSKCVLGYQKILREATFECKKRLLSVRLVSNNSVLQHNKDKVMGEFLAKKDRFQQTNSMR